MSQKEKRGGLNIAKEVTQIGMSLTGRSMSCKVTFPGMSTSDPFWLILILAHSFMHKAVLLAAAEIKQAHLAWAALSPPRETGFTERREDHAE